MNQKYEHYMFVGNASENALNATTLRPTLADPETEGKQWQQIWNLFYRPQMKFGAR